MCVYVELVTSTIDGLSIREDFHPMKRVGSYVESKKKDKFICLHRFVEVSGTLSLIACRYTECFLSMAATPMEFDDVYEEIRGVLVSEESFWTISSV